MRSELDPEIGTLTDIDRVGRGACRRRDHHRHRPRQYGWTTSGAGTKPISTSTSLGEPEQPPRSTWISTSTSDMSAVPDSDQRDRTSQAVDGFRPRPAECRETSRVAVAQADSVRLRSQAETRRWPDARRARYRARLRHRPDLARVGGCRQVRAGARPRRLRRRRCRRSICPRSVSTWAASRSRSQGAAAKDDKWYDVQTKFDLAKAYQEMGDKEGAREILREVIAEGDADRRRRPRRCWRHWAVDWLRVGRCQWARELRAHFVS